MIYIILIESCTDLSPDPADCTRFVRCFHNIRVRFRCPRGTAWEDSLKTCIWKEYAEGCNQPSQVNQRNISMLFLIELVFL